jgi:diguanylate cyclase (GGDEF)-like protein
LGTSREPGAQRSSFTFAEHHLRAARPDPRLDPLTRIAAQLFAVPVAFISIIDDSWQSFKSAVGLPFDRIPKTASPCAYTIRQSGRPLVVEDARADPRFAGCMLQAGSEPVRFYAGIALCTSRGHAIGTIGVADRCPRVVSRKEIANLVELGRLAESFADLDADREEARHAAIHDDLTQLPNRAFFTRATEAAVREARRCAVLYLDLDGFKAINDRWGHGVGDTVLRETASRLAASVRASDVLARIGGDEFAVLMHGAFMLNDIESVAQRIVRCLEAPFWLGDLHLSVRTSIGIARAPEDAGDAARLVEYADTALYAAKYAGRGCFCYYHECQPDRIIAVRADGLFNSAANATTDIHSVVESIRRRLARHWDHRAGLQALYQSSTLAVRESRARLAQGRLLGLAPTAR